MNYSPILSKSTYGTVSNNGLTPFNGVDDPSYEMFEDKFKNNSEKTYKNHNTALKSISYCDKDRGDHGIGEIFFSPENIKRVQKMLKREIYVRTQGKFKISDQNEADLLVAMRAVYMEYSRFLPFRIISQVKTLNRKLIEYIAPDIVTNVKQHYDYIKEINSPIKPIDRPLNVNNAGRKSLPSISTLYF